VKEFLARIDAQVEKVEALDRLSADPVVSVWMITYNHEIYIRQALDSILMQKVDFDYEVVIGEDNSTDRTREIVLEYQRRHPDKIRLRLARENLRSQGLKPGIGVRAACRGKYIAMLEGDDYWTDPKKLQKQVDFLEAHPEYVMCSHAANILNALSGKIVASTKLEGGPRSVGIKEIIMGGGALFHTASLVFRRDAILPMPDFMIHAPFADYPLMLLAVHKGEAYYLPDYMSVYRMAVPGSATVARDHLTYEAYIDRSIRAALMLSAYDKYTNYSYTQTVRLKQSDYIRKQLAHQPLVSARRRLRAYYQCRPFMTADDRLKFRKTMRPKMLVSTCDMVQKWSRRVHSEYWKVRSACGRRIRSVFAR
jgi:glycosyltransferase involved in cell wall biosynthesis